MATEGIVTGQRQKRYTRLVDMWVAPGLNPTNIEILNKLKSAEDRQFSKSMAVTGKVFDEDRDKSSREESHLIGVRYDIWKPTKSARQRALSSIQKRQARELKEKLKKKGSQIAKGEVEQLDELSSTIQSVSEADVDKARLVLKMFRSTGSSLQWRGSLEELCISELRNSLGSKSPLASFAVILPDYEFITHIQQNRRFLRIPPTFSFAYFQEASDRMWYVNLLCHWVSLGIDYDIEVQGRKVGIIDGKFLALGVDSRIHVYEPALAEDRRFIDLLSLFAASIGFQRRIRRNIRRRLQAFRKGKPALLADNDELWLQKNPRRLAR